MDEIPPRTIFTVGKQTGKITADSPGDTKKEKQDNKTKLIRKKKVISVASVLPWVPIRGSLSISNFSV